MKMSYGDLSSDKQIVYRVTEMNLETEACVCFRYASSRPTSSL